MLDSQDILFMVLAFCALWFTIFLCWLIYQAATFIKHLYAFVDELKVKVLELEDAIQSMRRKFDGNVSLIVGVADGIKKIIEALRNKDSRDD